MKRTFTVMATVVALAVGLVGTALAAQTSSGNAANSLGKTTLDTTVVDNGGVEMLYGDGIPNGEWNTAEVQGIVLGLRATDRTDGLLDVTGTNGNRVGVYNASTGFDGTTSNRAEWNFELSVDLRNATGNAEGKTVADYSLSVQQDFADFDLTNLTMPDHVCPGPDTNIGGYVNEAATICQQSWNPIFFGAPYNPADETTYNIRLVLTPKTFSGAPLAVAIQVVVTNP